MQSNRLQLNPEKTASVVLDQSAPASATNRYSDDWLDDRRSRSFSPSPGHIRRFGVGPCDAYSRVLDGFTLFCRAAPATQHPSPSLSNRLSIACRSTGYECRKGSCSRLPCRHTGRCRVVLHSIFSSSPPSPTRRPDKDL